MTYDDYIKNPMGKKNAVFSQREMYYSLYSSKLDKIMVRENGKFTFKQYVNKKHDKYYIYAKIPSEVIANFYYDVLIEFSSKNPLSRGVQSLTEYDVRFFSNDPAFVFTFAHAFIKNDLFIKELTDKMSKEAVKQVGKEKNPKDEVGYVKSLFFAYLLIKPRGLFNKRSYLDASEIDFKTLNIMHADKKILLRQEAKVSYDKKAKFEKKKEQNKERSSEEIDKIVTDKAKSVSLSNVIKKAKTTQTANKVSKIRKARKK